MKDSAHSWVLIQAGSYGVDQFREFKMLTHGFKLSRFYVV